MQGPEKYFEKNAKYYGGWYGILCPNGKQITANDTRKLKEDFLDNLGLGVEIPLSDVSSIKMSVNSPKEITACGARVIDLNGKIRQWVGIGWVECGKATQEHYQNIPHVIK
jgi:hypothetical protein